MNLIRLYFTNGLGVIIACRSGVLYSNQTGGTFCLQPTIEKESSSHSHPDSSRC